MMSDGNWDGSQAHTDEYLAAAPESAKIYASLSCNFIVI